ncbi:GntR family transcriptional regulator [uncultured Cetobacterium sp.]|uniref:GntR family transcriptional regulator n=1 Tax=uncultured Cetobacterium sp. TaxID=527638 RepID=UPI0025D59A17|nr:GntR family transcriptional regulator [uncultured Cetobacterium sp.]
MIKFILKKAKESNREYVYRTLKENIINFSYVPGDMISEPEICAAFEMSRTPIREAFIKLSEDNLVSIYPQKGTFISKINVARLDEAIFMRDSLEKSVFKVAINKLSAEDITELRKLVKFQEGILEFGSDIKEFFYLDNQFHATIFNKCGFSTIWNSIENISQDYNRFRFLDTISKINATKVIEQHTAIIEAIEKKDEDFFNEVISEHLRNICPQLEIFKEKFPNYFE